MLELVDGKKAYIQKKQQKKLFGNVAFYNVDTFNFEHPTPALPQSDKELQNGPYTHHCRVRGGLCGVSCSALRAASDLGPARGQRGFLTGISAQTGGRQWDVFGLQFRVSGRSALLGEITLWACAKLRSLSATKSKGFLGGHMPV